MNEFANASMDTDRRPADSRPATAPVTSTFNAVKTIPGHQLPEYGCIVVLNGPSSAGKSTLARELQPLLTRAHLHVQLDAFRAMEPAEYFRAGQPAVSALRLAALCRALNATAREYARHGQHVLLDHVLPPEGWQYLAEDLVGLPVVLVGVRCDRAVLEFRERGRRDRSFGLAESQFGGVHSGRAYDVEVDTTHMSASACAGELARWLNSSPIPKAFVEMTREHSVV